MVVGSSG